jgi:hypothetical protein
MNSNYSLAALVAAADKINAFARQLTLAGARRGSEALLLAEVWAAVMDDNGGPLDATDTPVGEPRLIVDVERFREDARTLTAAGRAELQAAEKAEDDIIDLCKRTGFRVNFESNTGSGQYGPINSLHLS